ncbi:hypothetical protein [Bosea minatitlanensis]|uniref:Uncharacterized protein n=1 Tax=Bosea minatitlanensis TaxID=128782 RepID=A0ABW0F388_9HYPH|nr:hypothetical protein [Bosea minatitlanensis]MCT4491771.1 hypothetical protein [Bosea minatitlanensis]
MQASSLPLDLRMLAAHLRRCAAADLGMAPQECARVAVLVHQAAHEADAIVAQAADVPELEDELLAVAHDPGRAEPPVQSGYQAALKAQQLQLQRALDAAGPVPVSRPGLAALAMPVGDTNVVTFPVAPHHGGDAA